MHDDVELWTMIVIGPGLSWCGSWTDMAQRYGAQAVECSRAHNFYKTLFRLWPSGLCWEEPPTQGVWLPHETMTTGHVNGWASNWLVWWGLSWGFLTYILIHFLVGLQLHCLSLVSSHNCVSHCFMGQSHPGHFRLLAQRSTVIRTTWSNALFHSSRNTH